MGSTHTYIFVIITIKALFVLGGEKFDDVEASCNATNSDRVEYEYNTDVVNSEHIITYKGYFSRSTRENYVSAALKNAGVSLLHIIYQTN